MYKASFPLLFVLMFYAHHECLTLVSGLSFIECLRLKIPQLSHCLQTFSPLQCHHATFSHFHVPAITSCRVKFQVSLFFFNKSGVWLLCFLSFLATRFLVCLNPFIMRTHVLLSPCVPLTISKDTHYFQTHYSQCMSYFFLDIVQEFLGCKSYMILYMMSYWLSLVLLCTNVYLHHICPSH